MPSIKRFINFIIAKSDIIALYICALSFFFWVLITDLRYINFSTGGWDLSLFTQLMWSLNKGTCSTTQYDGNFLTEHTFFPAFPISLIFKAFPHPLTLQYIKIAFFIWSAFIFYKITKESIGILRSLLLTIIYILFPANAGMLLSTFNFEPLVMPFIFLSFKYFEQNKYTPYLICIITICLIKENLPLLVFMLGIYGLIVRKENKISWGLLPLLIGLIFFYLLNFVLIPYLRKDLPVQDNIFWSRYSYLGETPLQIITNLFVSPKIVILELTKKENLQYISNLFGLEGIYSLFSPLILILSIPMLLKNILSHNILEKGILLYYNSAISCIAFLAIVRSFQKIPFLNKKPLFLIFILLSGIHIYSFKDLWKYEFTEKPRLKDISYIRAYMVNQIPPQAGVMSSDRTMPHLSQRKLLYRFNYYLTGKSKISRKPFTIPTTVDYILFDIPKEISKSERSKINKLIFSDDWTLSSIIENTVLLKRMKPLPLEQEFLFTRGSRLTSVNKLNINFNQKLKIINITVPDKVTINQRIYPINITWQKIGKIKNEIFIKIEIINDSLIIYQKTKNVGYKLLPPSAWPTREIILEKYVCFIPPLSVGSYAVKINVLENNPPTQKLIFSRNISVK